jgi:hypothetical protein
MSNCSLYYNAPLPACSSEILVRAHLTAETEYTWTVRDLRFGTHYIGQVETDTEGSFTLDTSAVPFPPALFNAAAGQFELTVKRDAGQCGASPMTLCVDSLTSEMYYAVLLSFYTAVGDIAAVVGCDCGMTPPEDPDDNAALVFEFTNTSSITITHNLGRVVQASVYDSLGNLIQASIVSTNLNEIQIVLSQALSGTVVID